MKIFSKHRDELTPETVAEMEALVQAIDPSLPGDHIREDHLNGDAEYYYLGYDQGKLVAMQSYKTYCLQTPFHNQPLNVFRGFLTYKLPDHPTKSMTSRTSIMHMKKTLGRFWMFKPFMAIGYSSNPRLYVQFQRFFPEVYPSMYEPVSTALQQFMEELLGEQLGPKLVDRNHVQRQEPVLITDEFWTHYRVRDEMLQNFYLDQGIFRQKGQEIQVTGAKQYLVGIYRPRKGILHLLRNNF